MDWELVVVLGIVSGTIAALIAPRKGVEPVPAFVAGFLFSIFAIAWIAVKRDRETTVRHYPHEQAYQSDRAQAQVHGWKPGKVEQRGDGGLTVTYQR